MSNSQLFLICIFSSIFFHILSIIYLDFEKEDDEIYVVSLSKFEEFSFSEPINPPPLPKSKVQKKTTPLQKIDPIKKKLSKEKKKFIKTEDAISVKQKSEVKEKLLEKKKLQEIKDLREERNQENENKQTKNEINKNLSTQKFKKKNFSIQNQKNTINNKLLSDYLSFISFEINKIAAKSYPVQSIRRREQGTIISIITLDKNGKVVEIKVKERSPKRLYKATVSIINKFKFPKPPYEILDSQGLLKIKIPVNFILK